MLISGVLAPLSAGSVLCTQGRVEKGARRVPQWLVIHKTRWERVRVWCQWSPPPTLPDAVTCETVFSVVAHASSHSTVIILLRWWWRWWMAAVVMTTKNKKMIAMQLLSIVRATTSRLLHCYHTFIVFWQLTSQNFNLKIKLSQFFIVHRPSPGELFKISLETGDKIYFQDHTCTQTSGGFL